MTIMLALRGLLVITASCCCIIGVTTAPARAIYDQRQTGELNVQIQLKNLHIVVLLDDSGLLDNYTDYDYAPYYADFTIQHPDNELWLVGYGIENCGPGRRRNNTSLMCENDESADFPL